MSISPVSRAVGGPQPIRNPFPRSLTPGKCLAYPNRFQYRKDENTMYIVSNRAATASYKKQVFDPENGNVTESILQGTELDELKELSISPPAGSDYVQKTILPLPPSINVGLIAVGITPSREGGFASTGMKSEKLDLSHIPKGTKVLEVGSGSGVIAARIRDERNCDLISIEPGIEESNSEEKDPFTASCNCLGKEKVDKLTLQEAVKQEKYQHQFDVVSINKFNVPGSQKKAFIDSLKYAIKPRGQVIIHSAEACRAYKVDGYSIPYLIDDLQNAFTSVLIQPRKYGPIGEYQDVVIICSGPKMTD